MTNLSLTKIAIGALLINGVSSLISPVLATSSFQPKTLTVFGNKAYFSAPSPLGYGLWQTDGTKTGTVLIKDFQQGRDKFFQDNLTVFKGKLYFTACTLQEGCEIWQSNGTTKGTKLLKDIEPGSKGAGFKPLAKLNGKLYFRACTTTSGCENWTTDGTGLGTSLLKDINPGSGNITEEFIFREYAFPLGKQVLFQVCLSNTPCALWGTDGTETGTRLLKENLDLGGELLVTKWQDNLYFRGCQKQETTNDCGLWKTDGTEASTVLVKDFPGQGLSLTDSFTRYGRSLYFSAINPVSGMELWKTDGTNNGTVQVKDIYPGLDDSFPTGLTNINDKLCFGAKDPIYGNEIRRTNGNESGTVLVKDINPGSADSFPRIVAKLGNKLLFGATTTQGEQLWQTDCTNLGTSFVASIALNTSVISENKYALAIDNFLYLVASSSQTKRGLWKTDGTTNGTVLLKGLFYDNNGFGDGYSINDLTNLNGTLLFSVAYRVTSGGPFYELWKSDGTAEGTQKIYPN
jgi:trimeric autotransporter adhesin